MARFRYNGEPPRDYVPTPPPAEAFRVPLKNGTVAVLTPVSPATEFVIGQDIGHEITDERSLRAMRANPRFTEI